MKICLVYRKKGKGYSIEEIFDNLITEFLRKKVLVKKAEVPHNKISFVNIIKNIIFVQKQKGLVHVTGDIHYVTINPFKKTILTIHDVGSIMKGNSLNIFFKKTLWIWLPTLFVSQITVISNFSKEELLKIAPWAKKKITVIHNPVNSSLKNVPKEFNKRFPSILHIGTKPNKNLKNTIKALNGIACKLIVVGKLNADQIELLSANKIYYVNYYNIQYSKIKKLYEKCDIVSFISKYEGFGMPVIEAQRVGRPIITSNVCSIPEIAGRGAHFVNPENIFEIHSGFKKIISDNHYRQRLIKLGEENVKRFSINAIADQFINLYNKLYI